MSAAVINPKATQLDAEVISNKKLGSYHHIVLGVNELALSLIHI